MVPKLRNDCPVVVMTGEVMSVVFWCLVMVREPRIDDNSSIVVVEEPW